MVHPSEVDNQVRLLGGEGNLCLHPGVAREVDGADLRGRCGLAVRGVDAAVLGIGAHAATGAVGPHGEEVGLAHFHRPTFLDGAGRAAAGTAEGTDEGTTVGTAIADGFEVCILQFVVVACQPTREAIVERGILNEVGTGNDVDTIGGRDLVALLRHDVLGHAHLRKDDAYQRQK